MSRIVHPIPPVFDERSRVLVLGSMPSPASRKAGFNYGHPQNRFWRVMTRLADEPVPTTNDRRRDFCLRHHIALWDVLAECDIDGASDASIRNAKPNDLASIVRNSPIEAVFCTGAKAYELYCKLGCEEACGLPAVKLPSTSPANAACSLESLVHAYTQVFDCTHEFSPPTLGVKDVVELEQRIAGSGTSLAELMDRAGGFVAHRVLQVLRNIECGKHAQRAFPFMDGEKPLVVIMCGNGNNGGDGWVAAELLADAGVPTRLISSIAPEDIKAQPAHDAALRAFPKIDALIGPADEKFAEIVKRATIVVDALFGCGLRGGIQREPFRTWVTIANQTREQHVTIAVDVPSGVNADTGYDPTAESPRIIADETITMIVPKPGLSTWECGTTRIAPLAYIEPILQSTDR